MSKSRKIKSTPISFAKEDTQEDAEEEWDFTCFVKCKCYDPSCNVNVATIVYGGNTGFMNIVISSHTERIGFGSLMIGASILMLGAALLHPTHSIEDGGQYYHATRDHNMPFYVAHTLFFFAATLLVSAVVGMARLVHPSHPIAAF